MHISIKQYEKSFDVLLHSTADSEAFLTIKGCRVVQGKNGAFVSMPATKNESTGKWWNHVYCSPEFQDAVLKKVKPAAPAKPKPGSFDDMSDDIPL